MPPHTTADTTCVVEQRTSVKGEAGIGSYGTFSTADVITCAEGSGYNAPPTETACLIKVGDRPIAGIDVSVPPSVPPGVKIGSIDLTKNQAVLAGIAFISTMSLSMEFALPQTKADPTAWTRVSGIIGWVYFWAWSVSFVPQLYSNWVRKSVVGQNLDFVFLNALGFVCYSIFNLFFFFNPTIGGVTHTVAVNDVAFAVYALLMCIVNVWQVYAYDRGTQKTSKLTMVFTIVVVVGLCGKSSDALDLVNAMGSLKVVISIMKYFPQVYFNFERKLTVGWSIWNVLLDFTGGSLSIAQELLDTGAISIAGNPVKIALGLISIVYDTIFMIQHYCLYRDNNRLLQESEETDRYMKTLSESASSEAPQPVSKNAGSLDFDLKATSRG